MILIFGFITNENILPKAYIQINFLLEYLPILKINNFLIIEIRIKIIAKLIKYDAINTKNLIFKTYKSFNEFIL